jgi:hypothetical protein
MTKIQKKILLNKRNYDLPYEPWFSISDQVQKIKNYEFTINGAQFEYNEDKQILKFHVTVEGILFHGRINYTRIESSEYPHTSQLDLFIRKPNGEKVWLVENTVSSVYFNGNEPDSLEVDLEGYI